MVEWKKLGDICIPLKKEIIKQGDLKDGGKYPVTNSGITIYGYYDNYNNEGNAFTLASRGEYAGYISYLKDNFWAGGLCYPYRSRNESLCLTKFIYGYLKNKEQYIMDTLVMRGGIPALNKADVDKIVIPIPSLFEQTRIVGILDTFTSTIENLKEQIAERRKQYEHYRDQLLDLEGKESVEMKPLKLLAEIGTGSSNTQDELDNGKYPFYVRSQIVRWKDEYEFDETAIITSGDGVGVGKVLHYVEGKYALHQRAYRIHITSGGLLPKYLFYYMQKTFYGYIMQNAYAASVTSIRRPMLLQYPVPIISLDEQSRIVSSLDTFEASIANLEAQLKQREKQYEYYRNKLLTFK